MSKEYQTSQLHKAIAAAASRTSSETMNGYGRFWDAYTATGEVLYVLNEQGAHNPAGEVSESVSKRISLTTGLLKSTIIVEQAITCGFYWAASALLRQHMEALARVIHIRKGEAGTERKPPHVGVLPFDLARNYGRLSELAHVSSGELIGDFSVCENSELVASSLPIYRKDWANNLLATHTVHMITLAAEIHYLHTEIYPVKELWDVNKQLYEVAKILEELGHWKELNQSAGGESGKGRLFSPSSQGRT
ncbi:MAG: hypothetical protein JRF20_01975 [Deltaproteobacteria bacterium]|nr:hypothetical protein [Deltaproteobacteria bacterium]MBW1939057.1 hypothetical protein [Deltaproteobacteria bacterium]MBW1964464.1 hypothetical protein [Deltaproteobacteria bacterium]MBW2349947.1 hypothetical protein [Deltaproteobacteria bacterium]